jgi:hypothetical protein
MNVRMYAGPGGNRGEFLAWDPVKNEKVWAVNENFPVWSGALVTAGDVVFYGRWMAGSRRLMRRVERCCGSSSVARESSASRFHIVVRMGSSTLRFLRVLVVGPERSLRVDLIRVMRLQRSGL